MKKQKLSYILMKPNKFSKKPISARKEIPYEIKLAAKMFLDESLYFGNKSRLEAEINHAIDDGNRDKFHELSFIYQPFTWE